VIWVLKITLTPRLARVRSRSWPNSRPANSWVPDPVVDNDLGLINFAGVILDDGCWGENLLTTILFQPKQTGQVTINFADVLLLANDGQGTNILEDMAGATYSIVDKSQPLSSDFNEDGKVGLADISILVSNLTGEYHWHYDLNQDGQLGLVDLSILIFRSMSE
jgi:hypothetical protein